jgi:peptidoglycan L-alanyl-D-glutamate endopeptidase CwlK
MYKFSKNSEANLFQCHNDLQTLANKVMELQLFDFGITCGYRSSGEQEYLYNEGKSKVKYPNSEHNKMPSRAFDFCLYINGKLDWHDLEAWYMAVGVFRGVAAMLNIKIRVGADWDGDFTKKDQSFHDLPHIELIKEANDN